MSHSKATFFAFIIFFVLCLQLAKVHSEPSGQLASDDEKFRVTHKPYNNVLKKRSREHDKDDDDDEHKDFDDDDKHDKDKENDSKEKHGSTGKGGADEPQFGFFHAFLASISVIVVSELGDKTFFIAAIMAMKHPRIIVYTGAILALGLMTLLSALLGGIVTKIIPRVYTFYISSVLFAIFGLKMLYEGWNMSPDEGAGEYEEAQQELKKTEEEQTKEDQTNTIDVEAGTSSGAATSAPEVKPVSSPVVDTAKLLKNRLRKYLSPIFLQSFILTFLAEWGDRSQISTIILGARENMFGTIIGGTLGHGLCTGLAVIGGRFVAQKISVRSVTLCGAFVFLFFAFSAFFFGPGD